MKRVSPLDHEFEVPEAVYNPAEDSWLLAEALDEAGPWEGARAADVGCGAGVQAVTLADAGARVLAVDRLPAALRATRANARSIDLASRVDVVRSDLLTAAGPGWADVVACNPPYLPETGLLEGAEAEALEAGETGVETALALTRDLDRVLAPGGRAYVVSSTVGDPEGLEEGLAEAGLEGQVVAEESFPFEILRVREIRRASG